MSQLNDQQQRKIDRIRWAARRGMLELDLVLSAYIDHRYFKADEKEQAEFHQLLECEDQDLFGWFIQSKEVPKEHRSIVQCILSAKKASF
jgi:antitoxin CptB